MRFARVPVKQAVISPSALSLMYPARRACPTTRASEFIEDLINEHVKEVRRCLAGRRAFRADRFHRRPARASSSIPPGSCSRASSISTISRSRRLTDAERRRVGVHTCPGGDRDSTHSADVPYAQLLPSLFQLNVTNFYVALAGETRPRRRARAHRHASEAAPARLRRRDRADRPAARNARRSRARPRARSGARTSRWTSSARRTTAVSRRSATTVSTSRELAFAKIRARVAGTALADKAIARARPQ